MHPSELPSFDGLVTTASETRQAHGHRALALVMVVLLIAGGAVLVAYHSPPTITDAPTQLAASLAQLPSTTRAAAADTVDLTIATGDETSVVPALVLPHDFAVTTTKIPVTATIRGTSAQRRDFAVTLVGRDDVMGFSIVHLGAPVAALQLDPMPASTEVVAVAPIVKNAATAPEYAWTETSLGDPTYDAQGVVRYLATRAETTLADDVDALAIDHRGHVVAIMSSSHKWYAAQFVAQVAVVMATGSGCHADLDLKGTNQQGGGVLVTNVQRYGAAAHANLVKGDVITAWNGVDVDTWAQLQSVLYLTPAYTKARVTYQRGVAVHHTLVTLACASKLVP